MSEAVVARGVVDVRRDADGTVWLSVPNGALNLSHGLHGPVVQHAFLRWADGVLTGNGGAEWSQWLVSEGERLLQLIGDLQATLGEASEERNAARALNATLTAERDQAAADRDRKAELLASTIAVADARREELEVAEAALGRAGWGPCDGPAGWKPKVRKEVGDLWRRLWAAEDERDRLRTELAAVRGEQLDVEPERWPVWRLGEAAAGWMQAHAGVLRRHVFELTDLILRGGKLGKIVQRAAEARAAVYEARGEDQKAADCRRSTRQHLGAQAEKLNDREEAAQC